MLKYTVEVSDEDTKSFFEKCTFRNSAEALEHFFTRCATKPYRNYQVVYTERLSANKCFRIKNVQRQSPKGLLRHEFIVTSEETSGGWVSTTIRS